MLMALAEDRVDFVRLFVSYGVSITKVVDQKTLEFLYYYRAKQSTLKYELAPTRVSKTEVTNRRLERFCQQNKVDLSVIGMDQIKVFIDELTLRIRHGTSLLSSNVRSFSFVYLVDFGEFKTRVNFILIIRQ